MKYNSIFPVVKNRIMNLEYDQILRAISEEVGDKSRHGMWRPMRFGSRPFGGAVNEV